MAAKIDVEPASRLFENRQPASGGMCAAAYGCIGMIGKKELRQVLSVAPHHHWAKRRYVCGFAGHFFALFLKSPSTAQHISHAHTPAASANTHAPNTYCQRFIIAFSNVISLNNSDI